MVTLVNSTPASRSSSPRLPMAVLPSVRDHCPSTVSPNGVLPSVSAALTGDFNRDATGLLRLLWITFPVDRWLITCQKLLIRHSNLRSRRWVVTSWGQPRGDRPDLLAISRAGPGRGPS